MRPLLTFLLLFFISCKSLSEKDRLHQTISGNWLVLSADHTLEDGDQIRVYAQIQDSIVAAKCLKLITFHEDGGFQQIDFPDKKGKWAISPNKELYIAKGGKGFEDYKTSLVTIDNNNLSLLEHIRVRGESIRVTWSMKKIKDGDLYSVKRNAWRKKPVRPESEEEIRERLAMMLNYYADYDELVGKEVSYFIPGRVILPLKFYQHAMGVLPYDPTNDFAQLFYNTEQAQQAYGYLKKKVYELGNRFPDGEDYMDEYIRFMRLVAKEIE